MLSIKEIESLYKEINNDVVQEGSRQAEDRLKDALENKKGLEQKASILLLAYVLSTIAIFFVMGIFSPKPDSSWFIITPVLLIGLSFVIGCGFLIISLMPAEYGVIGRYPDAWLRKDILDGDRKTYSLTMAYILHNYQVKIEESDKSNKKKVAQLKKAIYCGMIAISLLFVIIISMIFSDIFL